MKVFLLLNFIPSLILAETICPNIKTTCPEDERCCEVNGEYSCCDPGDNQDVPDIRMKVFPGVEVMASDVFANTSLSTNKSNLQHGLMCDLFCSGTCCEEGCCSYSEATCCGGKSCCPSLSKCCKTGGCCPQLSTCCGGNRCCPGLAKCCGTGCCQYGYKCCGSWCCHQNDICGSFQGTCISKGTTMTPQVVVLVLLVASVFVSRHL